MKGYVIKVVPIQHDGAVSLTTEQLIDAKTWYLDSADFDERALASIVNNSRIGT